MAIRKGRNEAADKLFTYVAIAVVGGLAIYGLWYLWKQLAPTVGLMTEVSLLETEVSLQPGEAKRFEKLEVKPMGKSSSKYRLEIDPSRGEAFAGVVKPGLKLDTQNVIWYGSGSGILTSVQGRPRHLSETISPGRYDVVIENRAQSPCTTKLIFKIVYDK